LQFKANDRLQTLHKCSRFSTSADCDLHSTFRTSGIDVRNNHTRYLPFFAILPIIASFMSGKFRVRRYKNVVWINDTLSYLKQIWYSSQYRFVCACRWMWMH